MTKKHRLDDLFAFEPYRPHGPVEPVAQSGMGRLGRMGLPICSGDECARALEKSGMRRFDEGGGVVWMECGATFVAVPACDTIPHETLIDILDNSGLSPQAFVRHLEPAIGA